MHKHVRKLIVIPAITATLASASASAPPASDTDTTAWWKITATLSSDAMEGRDTGSNGYDRAAKVVAKKFKAAGLSPLGKNGDWFQGVSLMETQVSRANASVGGRQLKFLYDFTVTPTASMPRQMSAHLAYRGYCAADQLGNIEGKLVICHGTNRLGLPTNAQREAAVKEAGGIGIFMIADPGFSVEPPRWPYAYAREVSLESDDSSNDTFLRLRLNADALEALVGQAMMRQT